jgi:hypothetical protein
MTHLAFFCSLTFFRHLWQPQHPSTACAYLGCELFAETRLASSRGACLDGEEWTSLTSQGTFAYTTHLFPPRFRFHLRWTWKLKEVDKMTGQQTTSELVIHLINTRLGAWWQQSQASKIKGCSTWTSTACLSGSTQQQALVGRNGPIACYPAHTRGVRYMLLIGFCTYDN